MRAWRGPALPPIHYRGTDYAHARDALLRRLVTEGLPEASRRPLERLRVADEDDWIVALCDAWGALAEVISFYQDRVVNEAFLPTASLEPSKARIYHSLGHQFPPNASATASVAYHLSAAAAGIEAVGRARRSRGGTGAGADARERLMRATRLTAPPTGGAMAPSAPGPAGAGATTAALPPAQAARSLPPAGIAAGTLPAQSPGALGRRTQVPSLAQVRAVPGPDGQPPTFVTLAPLDAQVTASKLKVVVAPASPPPALGRHTTQIELAGLRTGLAVGQPIMIRARDASGGEIPPGRDYPWIRVLTSVQADPERKATRIGWDRELGQAAEGVTAPVVYGFASSSALVGAAAPAWSTLTPAAQMAVPAANGDALPVQGGIAKSGDGGATWTICRDGIPPGTGFTALTAFPAPDAGPGIVIAAAGAAGIFRSEGGGAFAAAVITGAKRYIYFVGGTRERMLAGASNGTVYESSDGGITWSVIAGGPPKLDEDRQLIPYQLPPVPVRSVQVIPGSDNLSAVTDAGEYVYADDGWRTFWSLEPGPVIAGPAVPPAAATPAAATPACSTHVFDLPVAALRAPLAAGLAPPEVVSAFNDYGIGLGPAPSLEGSTPNLTLTDGGRTFELSGPVGDAWQVSLQGALGTVIATASDGVNDYAIGGTLGTVADQWPRQAVVGDAVEVAPPVKKVAANQPAIVVQSAEQSVKGQPDPLVLDVEAVVPDTVPRFGRPTPVTRLELRTPLKAGSFQRSAATVWSGGAPLALLAPPPSAVPVLEGATLQLEQELDAPVERGRLASITGLPVGLAVAPLGGAERVAGPEPERVGPVQLDVSAVAVEDGGQAWLGTSEGVFSLANATAPAMPVATDWPAAGGRPARANAFASANGALLAASSRGVLRSTPNGWVAVGTKLQAQEIVAVALRGSLAAACTAAGDLYVCSDPTGTDAAWEKWGTTEGRPVAAAIDANLSVYVATAERVSRYDMRDDPWILPPMLGGESVTALVVAGEGAVWVGTTQGVQTLAGNEWRSDPARTQPVEAMCLDRDGSVTVAERGGVFRAGRGGWTLAAPAPRVAAVAMAAAPDRSFWFGARAATPIDVPPGHRSLELSHELLFAGVGIDEAGVRTLDQGALPLTLSEAFAENGTKLDKAGLVVTGSHEQGYWLARAESRLYVIAQRGALPAATVSVFANGPVAYATAAPQRSGAAQSWEVEVSGVPGKISVPAERAVMLPAGKSAPPLAETAEVAAVDPASAGPPVAGAGTVLQLTAPLAHVYDASTVQVNLNVVPVAQGAPVVTPIGSGDPLVPHQSFPVRTPIAAVDSAAAAPGPAAADAAPGPRSSLQVYVDGQAWTPVRSLATAGPRAQVYSVRTNPDGTATVQFGDGEHGARLPAGRDNVVASYLQGGGEAGAAGAGALIQPLDRPQLVTAVHNPSSALVPPVPAAKPAREAAVRALDQILTVSDYEDVARAQPGVGSATAELVASIAGRALVVTVARTAKASKHLARHVAAALGARATSDLPIRVVEARVVPVGTTLRIVAADHAVKEPVRAALDGFAAERPGAPLRATEVLSAATRVPGVVAAEIERWRRGTLLAETGPSLHAARASWPAGAPAPGAAELLVIDGRELEVIVCPPVMAETPA